MKEAGAIRIICAEGDVELNEATRGEWVSLIQQRGCQSGVHGPQGWPEGIFWGAMEQYDNHDVELNLFYLTVPTYNYFSHINELECPVLKLLISLHYS